MHSGTCRNLPQARASGISVLWRVLEGVVARERGVCRAVRCLRRSSISVFGAFLMALLLESAVSTRSTHLPRARPHRPVGWRALLWIGSGISVCGAFLRARLPEGAVVEKVRLAAEQHRVLSDACLPPRDGRDAARALMLLMMNGRDRGAGSQEGSRSF
ncbi:hypothetical protein C8R46DRAFT_466550 [Mycena filopes]|nr:hypothetical protein C8R46DRAFT_466550 [Mycena filopes]